MRDVLLPLYKGSGKSTVSSIENFKKALGELEFDPTGRDRRDFTITNDIRHLSSYERVRMNVVDVELLKVKREYANRLKEASPTTFELSPNEVEKVQSELGASRALAENLIADSTVPFEAKKEIIVWHGSSNSVVEILKQSPPLLNNGAYGHGFYLATMPGKSDQYARRDKEETYTSIIGYRCIAGHVRVNPHLNLDEQHDVETNKHTSIITKNRDGSPLRYTELIVRKPENLQPFVVFRYDLFRESVGLPPSPEKASGGESRFPATGV